MRRNSAFRAVGGELQLEWRADNLCLCYAVAYADFSRDRLVLGGFREASARNPVITNRLLAAGL